jgi:hypothetical protein
VFPIPLLIVLRLSLQVIIHINVRAFDFSRTYYETNRLLRTCVGHVDRYVEARPLAVPSRAILEGFQHLLFRHLTCCFLTGSFVNYVVGDFTSYGTALLFVAKADSHIQNFLFQRSVSIPYYIADLYDLRLIHHTPNDNLCIYVLEQDGFHIPLILFGIDMERHPCGPSSNVDFVNFVWEHFEMFSFKKVAMTYVPHHDVAPPSPPRLVYLIHHRAGSKGWRIRTHFRMCRDTCREDHREFTSCVSPAHCT